MIIHNIIFKLGSLEVYTKRNLTLDVTAADIPGYFWSDKYVATGAGPFPSIYQAMEHYTIVCQQRKANAIPRPMVDPTNRPEGKLITVDFKNKRRIS